MSQDISNAILSIIDELRASKEPNSSSVLAKLVIERVRDLPAGDGIQLRAAIQYLLVHQGAVPASPLLFPIVTALVEGRDDDVVCDPWAGIGALWRLYNMQRERRKLSRSFEPKRS
jgi:hypothetical protein